MNQKKEILLRFPILSDLHISGKDSEGSKKLKNLYNIIKSRGTCDLIMFAGDMTDFGLYEQIEEFADITTKNFDLNKTKLVFSVGNHELYNNELNHAPLTVGEDFKTAFKNKTFENASDFEIHHCLQHVVIKKIHFIGFNAYKYSGGVDFLQEDIEWLENAIDVAEDESEKNMPIFICAHPMIVGTCYGSDYGGKDGGYWASRRLYDILKKHPRVIYFAGHLHFPLQNEKSIWQKEFTAIGTSSTYFASLENVTSDGIPYIDIPSASEPADSQEFSQGLIAEVDTEGNTEIIRLDFFNNREIKEPWSIAAPNGKFDFLKKYNYEDKTKKCPRFFDSAIVFESKKKHSYVLPEYEITFDAAEDEDMVMGYYIEFFDQATNLLLKKIAVYSDFYKKASGKEMGKKIIKSLTPSKLFPFSPYETECYYIKITAFDCFGNLSNSIKSALLKSVKASNKDEFLNNILPLQQIDLLKKYESGKQLKYNEDYFSWPPFERGDGAKSVVAYDKTTTLFLNSGNYQFYIFPLSKRAAKESEIIQIYVDFSNVVVPNLYFCFFDNDIEYGTNQLNGADMSAYIEDNGKWKKIKFTYDGVLENFGNYKGKLKFSAKYAYNSKTKSSIETEKITAFKIGFWGGDDLKGKEISFGDLNVFSV